MSFNYSRWFNGNTQFQIPNSQLQHFQGQGLTGMSGVEARLEWLAGFAGPSGTLTDAANHLQSMISGGTDQGNVGNDIVQLQDILGWQKSLNNAPSASTSTASGPGAFTGAFNITDNSGVISTTPGNGWSATTAGGITTFTNSADSGTSITAQDISGNLLVTDTGFGGISFTNSPSGNSITVQGGPSGSDSIGSGQSMTFNATSGGFNINYTSLSASASTISGPPPGSVSNQNFIVPQSGPPPVVSGLPSISGPPAGVSGPPPVTGGSTALYGGGPCQDILVNNGSSAITVAFLGNGTPEAFVQVGAHQKVNVALPANWSGRSWKFTGGNDNLNTLDEMTYVNANNQISFDQSDIDGYNGASTMTVGGVTAGSSVDLRQFVSASDETKNSDGSLSMNSTHPNTAGTDDDMRMAKVYYDAIASGTGDGRGEYGETIAFVIPNDTQANPTGNGLSMTTTFY